MTTGTNSSEITALAIITGLEAKGIESFVYQTGGGTATIYVMMPSRVLIVGPGAYDYDEPGASTFDTGDLYVGTLDEDDPGASVAADATAEQIVETVINAVN
ncbi:hypothetical protein [Arthrobacter sp. zg-Y1110]|uniref:hypothetical protein n=1 Tax=Arthrobacter sp. zg-Y1110 TaxID=2886932 RepID=UPI001D15DE81|nr:hypothetical protein [Arthrobacter sp. zg-Y1110]MCC3292891.1 hypothetical protein [Arthrobacter sp. zg-Y1110]UWX86830.1 hypothetical protein N2K99_18480 [Arthrobacter sp. zg-Y1110]